MYYKKYKLTIIGFAVSLTILFYSLIVHVDLFEVLINQMHKLEAYEVDELIIPVFTFIVFILLDVRRRQKLNMIELEKVKIYKAMLNSSHHVLNNFLNKMQIFRLEAEKNPDFSPDVLELYNKIINDASTQIDALGTIKNVNELTIKDSVLPKPGNVTD